MRHWRISTIAIAIFITGCGISVESPNPRSTVQGTSIAFQVPIVSDVKSFSVWSSSLPGAIKKTYTNSTDRATIQRVLTWLKNSKEVGFEKPPIGKGGYPPGLVITLNNGKTISIGPAIDWSESKLANGSIEISGKNVVGYVAMAMNNQVVRLYSPELYKWLVNREWQS
jgi:hypothetical protein